MDKPNRTRFPKLMLVGAISFWRPDTLLHAFGAYRFNSLDVRSITAVMPLTLLLNRLICRYEMGKHRRSPRGGLVFPCSQVSGCSGEC